MWCGNDCGELSAGLEPVGSTTMAIGGGERNLRWRFRPTEEIVDSVRVVSPVVFAVAQAVSVPEALPEHQ